jgi:hypothetical protein
LKPPNSQSRAEQMLVRHPCIIKKEHRLTEYSDLDPTRPRIHCPQVLHLRAGTTYRSRPSQGREDPPILGIQRWKEEAQEAMSSFSSVADLMLCLPFPLPSNLSVQERIRRMLTTVTMHYDNVTLLTCKNQHVRFWTYQRSSV